MKALISILSWAKGATNGDNEAMRQTVLRDVSKYPGLECRFFIGDGTPTGEDESALAKSFTQYDLDYFNKKAAESKKATPIEFTPKDDEVILHVPDDYYHLSYKTREGGRWAVDHGFERVFKCDTDTFFVLSRLMSCGFEQHDYQGRRVDHHGIVYAEGGAGYWSSARLIRHFLDKPALEWAEDRWVGSIAQKVGVPLHNDMRFSNYPEFPTKSNNIITSHLVRPPVKYQNEMMYSMYRGFNS